MLVKIEFLQHKEGEDMRSDKTTCAYCGKTKEGLSFVIGASDKPDWCMIEGTGKIACPECYERAMKEGQEKIRQHVKRAG